MKKVLIMSYFFPPANFLGGDRVAAWIKHLQTEVYYPISETGFWKERVFMLLKILSCLRSDELRE